MWDVSNHHALDVVENVCPYCSEHLIMNKRSFANHVRWCTQNPKYDEIKSKTVQKIKNIKEEQKIKEKGELKKFTVVCAKCNKEFEVEEREKEFPLKEKYYCSRSCANSHELNEESRKKCSESVKLYAQKNGHTKIQDRLKEDKLCPVCGKVFHSRRNSQIYCSRECGAKHNRLKKYQTKFANVSNNIEKGKIIFDIYKRQCNFNFSLNNYPNEFDFSLIEKNGWYKAKNNGDNLYGVSRDHIFSINEAFKQKIDPYLISHPANCKLLLHSQNSSKSDFCGISIQELKKRIDEWNIKYGVYENKIDYKLLEEFGYKQLK